MGMKKETDLSAVKETAKLFLTLDIQETEFSPSIVKHPFTDSAIISVPNYKKEFLIYNLLEDNDALKKWQSVIRETIEKAESASDISNMITKSYRLAFLKHTAPHLSREDLSKVLAAAWITCEAPNNDPNLSKNRLLSMFKNSEAHVLMDSNELEMLRKLEDTVTVYRGTTSVNEGSVDALSWTLSLKTAEWFAHRFGEDGTVYKAVIGKEHILALFNGRNEQEVIVEPQYLTDITEINTQEPKQYFEQSS